MSDSLPRVERLRGADETVALADRGMDFALVAARFHGAVVDRLIEGAAAALEARGADPEKIELVEVPGAFELPAAVDLCVDSRQFDAVIALGCVLRGETPHFEYVAGECARGLARLARRAAVPVLFGVLTADTLEQAERRSALLDDWERPAAGRHGGPSNKGAEAAVAALEMIEVFREWADDDDDDEDGEDGGG